MQITPEIKLKGISMTPVLDKMITRGLDSLEKVCDYIISTRVTLEKEQARHQTGNVHRMRIDIRIPDRADIVVRRLSAASKKTSESLSRLEIEEALNPEPDAEMMRPVGSTPNRRPKTREEPVIALIRRTFDSARRDLRKEVEKQRGDVKTPARQNQSAVVERIFVEEGYGFLRTTDTHEQVYFNRNSMLHRHWANLTVGTIVRYTPQEGDKGLQASTVEPLDKRGPAEQHDQLHDIQDVPRA